MEGPMIFARVSFSYDQIKTALDRMSKHSERFIAYEHNSDVENIHVHFLSVGPTITTETMKNWIRKEVGTVKASQWSMKTAKDENCVTYMSKGKLEPVHVKGYTVEEIEQFRTKWVERPPVAHVGKDDKPSQYRIARELHETIHKTRIRNGPQNQLEDYVEYMENELHTYQEYCQLAIKLHHQYHIAFSFFSIDKVVHTAFTMRNEHRESFVAKLVNKFYG